MSSSSSSASSSTKRRACGEDTANGQVVKKRRTAVANDDDNDDDTEKDATDDSDLEIELLKTVDVRAHAVDWERLVQLVRHQVTRVAAATLASLVSVIVGPAPFIDRAGIAKNLQDRWDLIASPVSKYAASFAENEEATTTDLNSNVVLVPRNGQCVGCLRVVWRPAERVVTAARFRWLSILPGDSTNPSVSLPITIRCCRSCYQDHVGAMVSAHNTALELAKVWSIESSRPALREFFTLRIRPHLVPPGLADIILSFLF